MHARTVDVAGVLHGRVAQGLVARVAGHDGGLGGLVVVAAAEGATDAAEDDATGRGGALAALEAVVLWGYWVGGLMGGLVGWRVSKCVNGTTASIPTPRRTPSPNPHLLTCGQRHRLGSSFALRTPRQPGW